VLRLKLRPEAPLVRADLNTPLPVPRHCLKAGPPHPIHRTRSNPIRSRPSPSCRLLATLLLLAPADLSAESAPKTGLEVLQRMHDVYAKSWYHTLTAVRKTWSYGPGQRPDVQLWFESRAAPGLLRYEMGLRGVPAGPGDSGGAAP
jgi:hypothetical protein